MGEWLAFTFALSGRRFGFYVTQGVALGLELAGPSAREGRLKNCPPHFASKVSYNASPLTSAKCSRGPLSKHFIPPLPPCLPYWQKTQEHIGIGLWRYRIHSFLRGSRCIPP